MDSPPELKFEIWVWSDQWLLRYCIVFHWRSSSFEAFANFGMIRSVVTEIFLFYILRSSSTQGHLDFKNLLLWFSHLSLDLIFEYDPISGYWDILLFIFWGHLPFEVIFIFSFCKMWFGHLKLTLKFEYDPNRCYWDILLFIFWGRLP